MKEYNPNIYEGVHKVRITLQQWEYKGHIIYDMHGNCQGLSILNTADFETDSYENSENDCNLKFDEDSEVFSLELKNEEGNTLELHVDGEELNNMMVAIEILKYSDCPCNYQYGCLYVNANERVAK